MRFENEISKNWKDINKTGRTLVEDTHLPSINIDFETKTDEFGKEIKPQSPHPPQTSGHE